MLASALQAPAVRQAQILLGEGCKAASSFTRRRGLRWAMSSSATARDELATALQLYRLRVKVKANRPASVAPQASAVPDDALERRVSLLLSVGEECQTPEELRTLLQKKKQFNLYDGFEPSGRMHIAQGVFKAVNVNKCTEAGGTFIFWVADWFALMNDKMGGDLDKIKTVGQYLIEVWKAGGMDMTSVKFLWCSEQITKHANEYWKQALDIAHRSTLNRIKKCCTIMGRGDSGLSAAQILYPIMQCTDVFFLKADICQLGVDQRKVNMLARDYCDYSKRTEKPIILSHHMLYGLLAGQAKMSKSNADSAIFMEDSEEDVERKIRQAYCPRESAGHAHDAELHLVEDDLQNPCLDYVKNILFAKEGFSMEANGKVYTDFGSVKAAFQSGDVSETQLKDCLIREINVLLEPVRQHFQNDPYARGLLEKITQWKKENLKAPESAATRLKLLDEASKRATFAVFAPPPSEVLKLEDVWNVIERLESCPEDSLPVLWLEDWGALALGKLGAEEARIHAFYKLLLHSLQTLAPAVMERAAVHWQGEAILSGPSEYWISVINAGRRSFLNRIEEALPSGENLEYASQVMTTLMHAADVLALSSSEGLALCSSGHHAPAHRFAAELLPSLGFSEPQVSEIAPRSLRLTPEGEGAESDANILVTDKDTDSNRKIKKKAFCQPGNVDFCPPLIWAKLFIERSGEFVVRRSPDNGGDKTYTNFSEMQTDFASGALHPGDLKPSLSRAINEVLEPVRAGVQASEVLQEAEKALEGRKSKKK